MKIVNRKKFISSILKILGIILLGSFCISNVTLSHGETEYKTIYVSSGDTLWSIAKTEIADNEYYCEKDIRYVVDDISYINNLYQSNLKVGTELKIPTL